MIQLSLNLEFENPEDAPQQVIKKPKRIRSKHAKKKILYQIITREDGTVINDFDNWRTLRGYAVELFELCGFIPFGDIESSEQHGITVWHDIYKREPYTHQGKTYIGQEFEHYEAEVNGAELLPVLDRIKIYEEVLSRLKGGLSLEQTMEQVKPIIEEIKDGNISN